MTGPTTGPERTRIRGWLDVMPHEPCDQRALSVPRFFRTAFPVGRPLLLRPFRPVFRHAGLGTHRATRRRARSMSCCYAAKIRACVVAVSVWSSAKVARNGCWDCMSDGFHGWLAVFAHARLCVKAGWGPEPRYVALPCSSASPWRARGPRVSWRQDVQPSAFALAAIGYPEAVHGSNGNRRKFARNQAPFGRGQVQALQPRACSSDCSP